MPAMKRTIDALIKAGLREQVKVMVGGAPVSQAFADEIGADGYARDSTLAVIKAKALMGVVAAAA
jgi:5-methyltetrahydrofolate--homocysteine methyltransferase